MKCDVSAAGSPCTNCRKASRNDCKLHRRRRRGAEHASSSRAANAQLPAGGDEAPEKETMPDGSLANGNCNDQEHSDNRPGANVELAFDPVQRVEGDANVGACQCALVDFLQDEFDLDRRTPESLTIENIGTATSNLQFFVARKDMAGAVTGAETQRHTSSEEQPNLFDNARFMDRQHYIDVYLEYVNPGLPLIDADNDLAVNICKSSDSLLLNAVAHVAAHIADPLERRAEVTSHLYHTAKALWKSKIGQSHITMVQAALLLSWQQDDPGQNVGSTAWYWINMARTVAIDLGMHRNIDRSSLDPVSKSQWRRHWWLLFQCDVQISAQLGRPQSINLEDCDVEMISGRDVTPKKLDAVNADTVVKMTELSIVFSDVLRQCFGPKVTPSRRRIAQADADETLGRWRLSTSNGLEMQHTTSDMHLSFMWLYYYSILLLLHRPDGKEKRLATSSTPTDAAICSIAAEQICRLSEGLRERDQLKGQPRYIVHILLTACIEQCVESRLPDTSLRMGTPETHESLKRTMQAVADYWPEATSVLSRLEAAMSIMTTRRESITSDLQELQTTIREADASAQNDASGPMEGYVAVPVLIKTLFVPEALIEGARITRYWREWRQQYWWWSHLRCV